MTNRRTPRRSTRRRGAPTNRAIAGMKKRPRRKTERRKGQSKITRIGRRRER